MDLLLAAQAAFAKDKPRARELFEKVLRDHDPNNGRALYGIGLIEMDKVNLDEALQYFEKTIKSGTADLSMKTWSYIYSGRILDFKCQRAAAVENYRKAIQTGDNSQNAQAAAEGSLTKPFGGECPQ
jgi:tetratricopeptide (TPR) repeat protein